MLKHIRQIISGIRALNPDVHIRVERQRTHVILSIDTPDDGRAHVTCAVSPKSHDHAVRNSIKQADRLLKSRKKPHAAT